VFYGMTDRNDDSRDDDFDMDPEPTGVVSEYTTDHAHQDEVPAHYAGGPPRHEELSVTPSMMGHRVLEEATEAPGREMIRDPREPIDPDSLPA
tara:strand:- start:2526 stop:2804 length:279 start_codon:yes stop_codon:yes gene_type:complete